MEVHHVEPVEEVGAELAALDRLLERLVAAMTRTSTCAGSRPPTRPDLALLQHAQELGLEVERQVADLVEEERAAVGQLEQAGPVARGAGEGALRSGRTARSRAGARGWRRS